MRNKNEYGSIPFVKKQVHKNREPLDMPIQLHDMINDTFNEIFGVKLRSECLFGTSNLNIAKQYGKIYLIFPIGKFDFYWSERIFDLFISVDVLFKDYNRYVDKEGNFKNALIKMLKKNYKKNGDLVRAMSVKNEIMIDCKEYYAIKINITDEVEIYDKINHYRRLNTK